MGKTDPDLDPYPYHNVSNAGSANDKVLVSKNILTTGYIQQRMIYVKDLLRNPLADF
jgi:hypothetical protein